MSSYANHGISESTAPQHLVFQHHQEMHHHHHSQHQTNAPPNSQITSSHPPSFESQESGFSAPPYSQKITRVSTGTSSDAGNQSRFFNDQRRLQYWCFDFDWDIHIRGQGFAIAMDCWLHIIYYIMVCTTRHRGRILVRQDIIIDQACQSSTHTLNFLTSRSTTWWVLRNMRE